MSRRETNLQISLQQWRGVDQRTSPTLVQDGFFVMSRGVYFGLGDNCERIPGKKLSGLLDGPVIQVSQFGNSAFVQSMGKLWFTDIAGLIDFDITFAPYAPLAPTFGTITSTTIDVVTSASFPLHTLSFNLQRSLDNSTWTTIATGLATLQTYHNTGLTASTTYYYRLVSVGASQVPGPSASADTNPVGGLLRITEAGDTRITEDGDSRIIE